MYSRKTELRHIQPTDVYKLGQILDPSGSWKKLMQIIPKDNGVGTREDKAQFTNEYKYNNDHIRLIENESIRQVRLATEILFDEWGTSGKKRPTVGQLLDLLVKAELFRAADMVASNFLNEPAPKRPSTGPAAKVDLSTPFDTELFHDVEEMLNNGSDPSTEVLLDNANVSICEDNKDFYTKYGRCEKDLNGFVQPSPPPRAIKQSRIQQQNVTLSHDSISQEIPKFSQLLQTNEELNTRRNSNTTTISTTTSVEPNTELTNVSEAPTSVETTQDMLPMISALNITSAENEGENQLAIISDPPISYSRTSCNTSESSNIDDDDDDDDEDDDDIGLPEGLVDFDEEDISAPNRSLLEQRSSNNDSSLTNVTGTSGDNSFELSMNDGSFDASNDNIPHLSVFLQ